MRRNTSTSLAQSSAFRNEMLTAKTVVSRVEASMWKTHITMHWTLAELFCVNLVSVYRQDDRLIPRHIPALLAGDVTAG